MPSKLTIQGIECTIPDAPDRHLIQNYGKKKSTQKWERTLLPEFTVKDVEIWDGSEYAQDEVITWDEACRQEHIKIHGTDPYDKDRQGKEKKVLGVITDPDYSMECLNTFREQELYRIKNGHWIYINGTAYYLTGNYYFYLNYWELKDGYAEFRSTDMELFLFWEAVKKHNLLLGIIYITMRGVGKSFIAGCIDYYESITNRKANTTIQSKSDDDAADFFRDKVLVPVSNLPNFLVPINKHKGDITGQSTLEFVPSSRGSMNVRLYNKMKKDALYSKMQYTNSGEYAADGPTWDLLVQEEIGKTDPNKVANVYKRLMVNQFTVFRGNKKMGNIYASSTVEEMKEGGAECLKIWEESNQYKLNAAGMTNTGLARFFRSALEATYFDEYGFPDIEKSREFHDAKRKSLEHDPKALIGYKQKNPYTEEEAFWINIDKCVYNAEILVAAEQRIRSSDRKLTRKGDIVWKVKDKEAMFVDNEINGRWEVSFFDFEPNMVQINDGYTVTFTPKANHKRIMAFDPYSTSNLADPDLEDANDKRGSMGAAAVYNRYDMNIPEDYCDTIIADYLYRPDDNFDCFEDILCGAFFFGCAVFVETNKSNAMDYFRQRGYKWGYDANPDDFVWERPVSTLTKYSDKVTDGLYNNRGTIDHYTESTGHHIIHHGWKLKHLRVVKDWKIFNPLKTKKFDLAVAASLSIVASERKASDVTKQIDLSSVFTQYNNSGSYSVAI